VTAEESLLRRLKGAVWMVGNIDTDEDLAAWWRDFDTLFVEVSQDPACQSYAEAEAAQGKTALPCRS
jgi:hypothetical protein